MTDKINAETMQVAYNENYQTFLAKNADYGNSFEKSLNDFGYIAGIVRIGDKYNRLYNPYKQRQKRLRKPVRHVKRHG